MDFLSRHIPFEALADLAEGRAHADAQAETRAHLDACARCSEQFSHLEQAIRLMRADESEAAPPDAVAYAVNLFRRRAASAAHAPSRLRRVLASLSFDSAQLNPAFGVRSAGAARAATRQLLYHAGESDLDVRLAQSGDAWVVSGQLLGECEGAGRVELAGEVASEEAELNEQCEFTLPPVPAGTYALRLRFADFELEIPELELRP